MRSRLLPLLLVIALFIASPPVPAGMLAEALETVRTIAARGEAPIVVMDLDETLILSHARKSLAYRDALHDLSAGPLAQRFPEALRKAAQVSAGTFHGLANAYDPVELFRTLGVSDAEFIRQVASEMVPRYLSGRYIDYDSEVPCAASFVRNIVGLGAYPVFVSSRYESSQGEATRESLRRLRFIDPGTPHLTILRADGVSSIEFKRAAFRRIHEISTVGSKPARPAIMIENEPENMAAMHQEFPGAALYFVEGALLKEGPVPDAAARIRDYCE